MAIELKCPRCGVKLRIPQEKAGKKGRCPTCGGPIKVPLAEAHAEAPAKKPGSAKLFLTIGVPVVVVIGIGIAIKGASSRNSTGSGQATATADTSEAARQIEMEIYRLNSVERGLTAYQELYMKERQLRARQVLLKIRNYEPVSDWECELRKTLLDEQAKAQTADWQLNTPLSPTEQTELNRISQELQQRSADIVKDLAAAGITVSPAQDPMGRALVTAEEIAPKIVARKDSLQAKLSAAK